MNSKTLKVCYTNRTNYSSAYHSSGYSTVPKINVEGKWLEELGFHIGDRVNIEYDEGIIKITPAPAEEVLMVAEPAAPFISKKSSKKSQRNILR